VAEADDAPRGSEHRGGIRPRLDGPGRERADPWLGARVRAPADASGYPAGVTDTPRPPDGAARPRPPEPAAVRSDAAAQWPGQVPAAGAAAGWQGAAWPGADAGQDADVEDAPPAWASPGEEGLWRLEHPDAPPSDVDPALGDPAPGDPVRETAAGAPADDGWSADASVATGTPAGDVDPFVACRYLVAASGGWRASEAIRDHRCGALDPASPIALEKQRRLCLTGAHASCPTFLAARQERGRALGSVDPAWTPTRPVVRTAPVVVGSPQRDRAFAGLMTPSRLGEVALGVMAVVVVVLLGTRILGGSGAPEASPIGGVGPPAASATETSGPSSAPGSPQAGASSIPPESSGAAPASSEPAAAESAKPSTRPAASPQRTYKVRSGDTLTAIAAKYGTTVAAIMKLNKIKNARSIHSGQILRIP